jgi:endonuclease III
VNNLWQAKNLNNQWKYLAKKSEWVKDMLSFLKQQINNYEENLATLEQLTKKAKKLASKMAENEDKKVDNDLNNMTKL